MSLSYTFFQVIQCLIVNTFYIYLFLISLILRVSYIVLYILIISDIYKCTIVYFKYYIQYAYQLQHAGIRIYIIYLYI